MEKKPVIYLASPYTSFPYGKEEAYNLAVREAAWLINRGYIVFSPIVHSHPIAYQGGVEDSHKVWMEQDLAILEKMDKLYVLMAAGWTKSYGMNLEMAKARELGIPIVYHSLQTSVVAGPDDAQVV